MSKPMIPVAVPDIGERERRLVNEAVESGWVSSIGEFVNRFEREFAAFCESEYAIAVSNGTTAIEVTLKALGVGAGDEVIVPDFTFAAVPASVVHLGASPVLVDVDQHHWCLDPAAVKRAITRRTKAVIAVHSYGHPAEMDAILELCRARGIRVLEDCAEAHGARYRGRRVGSLGDAGTFSFYGNKIVTTGEGGMIVTQDGELADRIRMLKDHAMDPARRYFHLEAGYNFRMTNVQAALGCAQLARIDEFLAKRASLLARYVEGLRAAPLTMNPRMPWADPVNWVVCAVLPPELAGRRDEILRRLREEGIDTRPFFVPLSEMPPYSQARTFGAVGAGTPVGRQLSTTGFNLPTSTTLTPSQVEQVIDAVRRCLEL